ncbi:MAG: 50S ribosomal protein L3 [Candidatus Bathyarchaeota archaeon]
MGRRRPTAPRHGSLAYLPRGRAKNHVGKINHWPEVEADTPKLLGFAGYKVGMSYAFITNTRRGTPTFGQEVYSPITFIEAPPMFICGLRSYSKTPYGLKATNEAWVEKTPKDLEKYLVLSKKADGSSLKEIEASMDKATELRAVLCTQPRRTNVSQKKPDLFEVKVTGGTMKDQFEYLKGFLGREIGPADVLKEGQIIDIIAVTKGKGIQGPVKRWGVKTLQHKSRKTVRGVGTLGAWTPHYVMYTVPRAGQMGFHQRTEMNKRILKIGDKTQAPIPKGGFPHYGLIRDSFIILEGSIPSPAKRLIKLRYAVRPPLISEVTPNITYMGAQPQEA